MVDDLDYSMLSSPHRVLVNAYYYIKSRQEVKYEVGVSLRYKELFNFRDIKDAQYLAKYSPCWE